MLAICSSRTHECFEWSCVRMDERDETREDSRVEGNMKVGEMRI